MENGYYPIGGAPLFIASIIRSIEKFGGKVIVQADVEQILFDGGRVNGNFEIILASFFFG